MPGVRRGPYAMNLEHRVRLRISPQTYISLKQISDKSNSNVSRLIRGFLEAQLESLENKDSLSESGADVAR